MTDNLKLWLVTDQLSNWAILAYTKDQAIDIAIKFQGQYARFTDPTKYEATEDPMETPGVVIYEAECL